MKLTLEHLAPYLPYGLKIKKEELIYWLSDSDGICRGEDNYHSISIGRSLNLNNGTIKPILRPLSDLTKEIEHNSKTKRLEPNLKTLIPQKLFKKHWFTKIREDGYFSQDNGDGTATGYTYMSASYDIIQILLEWHFDVFGLIEKGLAINMNDL